MDMLSTHGETLSDRMTSLWRWGVRLTTRLALAFGLSTATAIGLGAAVSDNGFVQIAITGLAALCLWIPFFVVILGVERFFDRRRSARLARTADRSSASNTSGTDEADASWRRLFALAPRHSERLTGLRRSLAASRQSLGSADLDPDAHDLCVLIDRRLPELIHRELDSLAPDDRNRNLQIGELVALIEQFARHCNSKRSDDSDMARHEAAILRRRFEGHLTDRSERFLS